MRGLTQPQYEQALRHLQGLLVMRYLHGVMGERVRKAKMDLNTSGPQQALRQERKGEGAAKLKRLAANEASSSDAKARRLAPSVLPSSSLTPLPEATTDVATMAQALPITAVVPLPTLPHAAQALLPLAAPSAPIVSRAGRVRQARIMSDGTVYRGHGQ